MPPADSLLLAAQVRYGSPVTPVALLELGGPALTLRELVHRVEQRWRPVPRLWSRPDADERGEFRRPYRWVGGDDPSSRCVAPVIEKVLGPGVRAEDEVPRALGRTLPDPPGGLLWELRLLTESGSGRRSLLLSVHHALVDGVSVGLLMRLLCDGGPGGSSPARVDGSVIVSGRIRPSPARPPSSPCRPSCAGCPARRAVMVPSRSRSRVRAAWRRPCGWTRGWWSKPVKPFRPEGRRSIK